MTRQEVNSILDKAPYNPISNKAESSRGILLKKAFENGWVRIRGNSIQFSGNKKSVVENILYFFKDIFGPMSYINLDDFSTGQTWSGNFNNLKTSYDDGEFSDFETTSADSPFRTDTDVRRDIRQRITPPGAVFGESLKKIIKNILFS